MARLLMQRGHFDPLQIAIRFLSWIFVLFCFQVKYQGTNALEDGIFYFTSFQDVNQWSEQYCQCDIECKFPADKTLALDIYPYTLSPIALPDSNNAKPVFNKDTKKAISDDDYLEHDQTVLLIYTNPPPPIGSFSVSFGFQQNKECLVNNFYSPCYVSPALGKIRGVVLNAERTNLKQIKEEFTVEDPELFVSILNGGSQNEKKFYEAIFMGSTQGSVGERSTHTINGKSYPMEIYLFFIDETLPAMAAATILVVLVEEQEKMNPRVNPVVKAVANNLYQMERKFLKENEEILRRERAYHHLGPSSMEDPANLKKQLILKRLKPLPSSIDIERENADIQDYWEKLQSLQSNSLFVSDDHTQAETEQMKFIYAINEVYEELKQYPQLDRLLFIIKCFDIFHAGLEHYPPGDEVTYKCDGDPPRVPGFKEYKINENMTVLSDALKDFYAKTDLALKNSIRETVLRVRVVDEKVHNALVTLKIAIEAMAKDKKYEWPNVNITVAVMYKVPFVARYELVHDEKKYRDQKDANGNIIPGIVQKYKSKLQNLGISQGRKDYVSNLNNGTYQVEMESITILTQEEIIEPYHDLRRHQYKRRGSLKYGNMDIPLKEDQEYEELRPIKFFLKNTFQVSWLIPEGGGYYIYKGSSPVPPCFQAERVIVFKKPIKMSKEQIQALSVIPTSFSKKKDIHNTLGRLNRLRRPDIPIYFDTRNHQFMRRDGFHKNSVHEYNNRRNHKNIGNKIFLSFINSLFILCTHLVIRF